MGAIILRWNSSQTAADRAKLCIEEYWEVVMGGLSIAATPDLLTPKTPNWGSPKLPLQIAAKRKQMEQRFEFIGVVKS